MDWVKFYTNTSVGLLDHNGTQLTADLSKINFDATDPLLESQNLIKHITKIYNPPYYIMVSGGIDSQAVLYAWKTSGVPFNAISFTYNQRFNEHDLHSLKLFTKRHNINVTYIDMDYFSFLKNDLISYSTKYVCNSPQITFYMKFCDQFNDGTLIFSGNHVGHHGFRLTYSQLGLLNYQTITGKHMIPYFLMHDENIAGAFFNMEDKIIKTSYGEFKHDDWFSAYSTRCLIYKESGFDIMPSSNKYTGFENYKIFFDAIPNLVPRYEKSIPRPAKHNYDLLYRWPLYKINNYIDVINLYPNLLILQNERKSKHKTD